MHIGYNNQKNTYNMENKVVEEVCEECDLGLSRGNIAK